MKTFTFCIAALVALVVSTVSAFTQLTVGDPLVSVPVTLDPKSPAFSNDGQTLFISGSCTANKGNKPCTLSVVALSSYATGGGRELDTSSTVRCILTTIYTGATSIIVVGEKIDLADHLPLSVSGDTGILGYTVCNLTNGGASVDSVVQGLIDAGVAGTTAEALNYLTDKLNGMV